METRNKKFSSLSNAIKLAAMIFSLIGILGLLGAGLCDHIISGSPSASIPEKGLTEVIMFKGDQRFVTHTTASLCAIPHRIAAVGIGIGLFLGVALYVFFRRLPHE
jgi:hypothetical protein